MLEIKIIQPIQASRSTAKKSMSKNVIFVKFYTSNLKGRIPVPTGTWKIIGDALLGANFNPSTSLARIALAS